MNPNLVLKLSAFAIAADRVTVLRSHHEATLGDRRGIETDEFKQAQDDMARIMHEIEEMTVAPPYCTCRQRLS